MQDIGFVSAILSENSFDEVVKFASKQKFKCVEMMCWPKGKAERRYAGVTHINVENLDVQQAKIINSTLSKNNIYISGLGYYPNPLDSDKKKSSVYIEHIKEVIIAAAKLGIPA